jgi:signal transduction histidine kinase
MTAVFGPSTVTVGVGDDGEGFELPSKLSELTRDGHFGLMGVTERSQLIGGRLYVESARGHGTTIIVQAARSEGALLGVQASDEETVAAVRCWLAATTADAVAEKTS